jgi:hypothetical protein
MTDDPLKPLPAGTSPLPSIPAPQARTDLDTEAPTSQALASQQAKQENFSLKATDLLPTALRVLQDAMEGDDPKDALAATKLLLRNQGLLVDKAQTVDKDALTILLEEIRKPRTIIKTLPNPKDYVNGTSKEV